MFFLLILVVILVFLLCKFLTQPPRKFPPGPPNYPLVGGLLSMPSIDLHFTQQEWLTKYGGVVGIMMGPRPGLFIQGAPYVQDALKKPEFQGRPETHDFKERSYGKIMGIFTGNGAQWQVSRKFTVRFIKGVKNFEDILQLEMDELTSRIKSGQSYQIDDLFRESTVNIIWTILSGMRCTVADQRIKTLLDNLTNSFRSGRPGSPLSSIFNIIPPLSRFDEGKRIQRKATHMLRGFFKENIQEHLATLDPKNPRDLYDAYLIEQKEARERGIDADLWSEENLIIVSMDIFSAGSRRPTLDDKHHLHYVQAIIHEVFRINTIAPITVPHCCMENTTFYDYFIPKDTMIFISLWSLFHDEKNFEEPSKFKPERFLSPEGKFDKSNPNAINFGIGRRSCAGDFVAQNVMFLYVTTFFQKYSVHRDPNNPDLSTKAMSGFTTAPQPFKAIIRERY
ncbi:hypothetical protein M8J75_006849 [Diaphorina citri]|nr:hypothetical protein M8J75_006849 [Diaphorina citri]